MNTSEIATLLGALELGIIPPDRCVDQALAKLSKAEQRVIKRKFRKVVRKLLRPRSKAAKRSWARDVCLRQGKKILSGDG